MILGFLTTKFLAAPKPCFTNNGWANLRYHHLQELLNLDFWVGAIGIVVFMLIQLKIHLLHLGAALSLFSPPPLTNKKTKGFMLGYPFKKLV